MAVLAQLDSLIPFSATLVARAGRGDLVVASIRLGGIPITIVYWKVTRPVLAVLVAPGHSPARPARPARGRISTTRGLCLIRACLRFRSLPRWCPSTPPSLKRMGVANEAAGRRDWQVVRVVRRCRVRLSLAWW